MKRARYKQGSLVLNKRSKTWHYLWCQDNHRHSKVIGTLRDYPTKAAAWQIAERIRESLRKPNSSALTVAELAKRYEDEKLPRRANTARVYRAWLHNQVLPYWGNMAITDIQPRRAELWLRQLDLSPKSKSHVRNMLRLLVDYAMWSGVIEVERNPIDLVRVKGAGQRIRQPRSLTVEEFQKLIAQLHVPFRTMALVAVCFGLRVSELLALRWSDVDWLGGKLTVERRIVAQQVDDVKTVGSRKTMSIDTDLVEVLKQWKQATDFGTEEDWIFASPVQLGRLPYCDSGFWRELQRAAKAAGIGGLGTHAFRHTYRSWLDAVGTPIAVQQKMMRHADIRTTLNIYGDVVTNEMAESHSKVVGLALGRPLTDCNGDCSVPKPLKEWLLR
jgi:integrase